ncbi:MAG TPA: metallophosphoesterase [Acetobacteraceae bacterium]|nr:metallophosphoesterase [Acetobacteraceae bacterium]
MRILYFSDVHIEIRESQTRFPWTEIYPLDLGPDLTEFAGAVDLAVLAGDIGTIRPRNGVSTLGYAEQVATFLRCAVVLIPGNHEYYRGDFDVDRADLLAAKVPGVTALDRGEAFFTYPAGILRVLGATLWTDYKCLGNQDLGMFEARRTINDHRAIRRRGDAAPFLPIDALEEHELSRDWLKRKLAEPHAGRTLVVTHHVAHSAARHPGYGMNNLAPAFYSDCDDLIMAAADAGVVGWIVGHHHWTHQIEVGAVRLLSAQPGYPGEQTNWSGPGIIEF